ncbi:MAG: hypothetical protein U0527_11455 [Candidatus Eisenbacteria bacterium]
MPRSSRAILTTVPLLLLLGCKSPELASGWRDREIKIDGEVGDWPGSSSGFDDERVKIAVRNDADFLYLGLSSTHPAVLGRALLSGFTVWFDPMGGKAKTIGVRYPLGMREMDFDIGAEGRGFSPAELLQRYRAADAELRLFTGPNESRLVKAGEIPGVEAAMDGKDETFTFELKVPLRGAGFAIGAEPGAEVGLGFEIPKPPRDVFVRGMHPSFDRWEKPADADSTDRPDENPTGPDGTPRAPIGMERGEDREHGFGRRPGVVQPLDLWARAHLATGP